MNPSPFTCPNCGKPTRYAGIVQPMQGPDVVGYQCDDCRTRIEIPIQALGPAKGPQPPSESPA